MAQWAKIAQIIHVLPSDTVHSLYPPNTFPIEARFYAAEWIENQRWEDYSLTRPELENNARELMDQTRREFQNIAHLLNVVERIKLIQVARHMGNYSSNALQFVVLVRDTLRKERELINSADPSNFTFQVQTYNNKDITFLEHKVSELMNLRQATHQHQEELNWERQNLETIEKKIREKGDPEDIKKSVIVKQHIMKLEYDIDQLITRRARCLDSCVSDLQNCQRDYLGSLQEWKYSQHKAVIGFPFDSNLLPLQMWSEQLLGINERLRQEYMLVGTPIPACKLQLETLLHSLIDSSLVVEKQPPQVIKTQSKFSTTVRCLLGEKVMPGKPVVIKAQIVNELQAKNLGNLHSDTVAELINNQSILEKHPGNKTTCATFRNMSVRKIKRADRKGSESVTEEKFAILFSTEITYVGCDTSYQIQMISLPVVITVHGSQDSNALATILWDCAFARPDRVPFAVPDSVSWREMCQTLNCKFTSEVNTQHNLDKFNQHFLAQKIFDKPDFNGDFSEMMVSWAQFNKEVLPGRSFTFWQWFEGVTELSKKHLRPYWSEGLIFGFIGKHHLHMILADRPNGTFLLRFSDSEIGGITIAYVSACETGGQKVQNIQPFSKKDLEIRSLADRIRDINEILYLYPNVGKDEAFGKFYTGPLVPPSDGYLPATLHTKVGSEATAAPPLFPINPVTPIITDPEPILDLPDLDPLYQDFEEFVLSVPPNGATMDMLED
ncbi:signal transducer and activator of transcription 5B-like [Oryzias latipes]|uniref:Signal transducer and activator of transcription n=1 Tax=Oryzias latipes TaxID=8090 RepID=A0A3B3I5E0_ORYLA|nr:signal transducer and activator of transcription 5B-like [Oryzias latipes]